MIKEKIAVMAATMILERLTSDEAKEWIDRGLDMLEDKIDEKKDWYDASLHMVIDLFRATISVPDND